jgi:hypothetical protein
VRSVSGASSTRAQRDKVEIWDALLATARALRLLPSSISRELGSKVGMEYPFTTYHFGPRSINS